MTLDATFDLLTRWRAGDREALGALIARDLEWIRSFVHRRLGSAPVRRYGDTDDFVQEAVMNVLRDGPRFVLADRDQFRRLLATIALNVIRSRHRALTTKKRDGGNVAALGTDSILMLDVPSARTPSPDEAAALAEEEEWLRLGTLLLDAEDQDVLHLHWEGRSDGEIGEKVGASGNAVRMRRVRAVARLTKIVLGMKAGEIGRLLPQD